MRLLTILAAAFAVILVLSEPVAAQDRGLERRTEMAERYIRLTFGDDLRPIVASLVEQELAAQPDLTAEQREWYRNNMPVFFEDFMDQLISDLAPRYAAELTEDELDAGIAFYSSPLGRSLARKETGLQVSLEEDAYAAAEAMGVSMMTKYCAAFDCPAGYDLLTGGAVKP